jgi:hypothetical protein
MNNLINKDWWKKAGIRAIKTMAQTALSLFTVGQVLQDIDWVMVASASLVAGLYSMLTSIAGLPEVEDEGGSGKDE